MRVKLLNFELKSFNVNTNNYITINCMNNNGVSKTKPPIAMPIGDDGIPIAIPLGDDDLPMNECLFYKGKLTQFAHALY